MGHGEPPLVARLHQALHQIGGPREAISSQTWLADALQTVQRIKGRESL